jgi:ATP-dependent DNA helicase RecQ
MSNDSILIANILAKLGIKELYPWQKQVIDKLLNSSLSQLVICPTAGGKSLTYQIPALISDGLTLVISPLKSLMADQVLNLHAKGFTKEVAFYNSSLDIDQKRVILKQISNGTIRLLYVAPERLHKDFINYLMNLTSNRICYLVIDEVHMISQAGIQFRPLYGQLAKARKLLIKEFLIKNKVI